MSWAWTYDIVVVAAWKEQIDTVTIWMKRKTSDVFTFFLTVGTGRFAIVLNNFTYATSRQNGFSRGKQNWCVGKQYLLSCVNWPLDGALCPFHFLILLALFIVDLHLYWKNTFPYWKGKLTNKIIKGKFQYFFTLTYKKITFLSGHRKRSFPVSTWT